MVMNSVLNWIKVKTALITVIIAVSPLLLKCQNHGLHAFVPEELDILISNEMVESIHIYFTGPHRKFDRIENKLIQIFRINRNDREIREFSMDYDSYYGYWTLYRFDENWNIIEERKYEKDTVVYACKEYTYNDDEEVIEECWINTFNEEKEFSPFLHRKLLFKAGQVIRQTTSYRSKNPNTRNQIITDTFNSRGRLKKRNSVGDKRKTITKYDRRGREKKYQTYELDTLTNKFSLKEERRYRYEYNTSENRLIEEIQTLKDSIIQISKREYFKDTLIHQEISENGKVVFLQHKIYDGTLLTERKIRGRLDTNFSVYRYEYVEK